MTDQSLAGVSTMPGAEAITEREFMRLAKRIPFRLIASEGTRAGASGMLWQDIYRSKDRTRFVLHEYTEAGETFTLIRQPDARRWH